MGGGGRVRRKTYNEALLEDLNRQINYWQGQAHILRKERDDEKRRNDALTIQFERLAGEVEEKNKIIAGLSAEVLRLKEDRGKEAKLP